MILPLIGAKWRCRKMSNYLQKIVYLTEEQAQTLFDTGSVTSNGITVNYDDNDLYVTSDDIQIKADITTNWNERTTFIPNKGDIIIYLDKRNVNGVNIPGIKIGDGLAYGIDLPFVGDEIAADLLSHINNTTVHITAAERTKWNNKINCEDEVTNETLVLFRN